MSGIRRRRWSIGEWTLLRTTNSEWRVGRTRRGAWWVIADRRTIPGVLLAAWRRRSYYPHPLYRDSVRP